MSGDRMYCYTFEDKNGHAFGSGVVTDPLAAKAFAEKYSLRMIEHAYEYVDSDLVEDFTETEEEEEE